MKLKHKILQKGIVRIVSSSIINYIMLDDNLIFQNLIVNFLFQYTFD